MLSIKRLTSDTVTNVLNGSWNHFRLFSHDFIPSLRPLLEILGVPLGLCHPEETREWRSEESENSLALQIFRYHCSYKHDKNMNLACWLVLNCHTVIILLSTHPVSFVTRQTRKTIKTTVTLGQTHRHITALKECIVMWSWCINTEFNTWFSDSSDVGTPEEVSDAEEEPHQLKKWTKDTCFSSR